MKYQFEYENELGHKLALRVAHIDELIEYFRDGYERWGLQGTYHFTGVRDDWFVLWNYYGEWWEVFTNWPE